MKRDRSKLDPSHCLNFLMSGAKWVWFAYLAKYSVITMHSLLSLSQLLSHLGFCSTFHGLLGVRGRSQQHRNKTKQYTPWFVSSSTKDCLFVPRTLPSPLCYSSVKWPESGVFTPHSVEPSEAWAVPQGPLRGIAEGKAKLVLYSPSQHPPE